MQNVCWLENNDYIIVLDGDDGRGVGDGDGGDDDEVRNYIMAYLDLSVSE